MARGLAVWFLLAVAAAASGRDEVPLAKLTPDLVRARLIEVLASSKSKSTIAERLKLDIPGFAAEPSGIEFIENDKSVTGFIPGKTTLVWRYSSTATLDTKQAELVLEQMRLVLSEALAQYKGADGKALLSADDWAALAGAVKVARVVLDSPKTFVSRPEPATTPGRALAPGWPAGYGYGHGDFSSWYGYGGFSPFYASPYAAGPSVPTDVMGSTGIGIGAIGRCGRHCWRGAPVVACAPAPVMTCGPTYLPPAAVAYAPRPQVETVQVTTRAAEPLVSRAELVIGKQTEDWAALYDAGFRAFWSGRHAAAVEYCAAAALLSDDPRAWYYLGLAQSALGDQIAGRAAVQYAAARVRIEPRFERDVNECLSRLQGVERDLLAGIVAEARTEYGARAALAARPSLRSPAAPTLTTALPK